MQVFLSIDFGEGEMVSQYSISQIINNTSVSIGLLGNCLTLCPNGMSSSMKPRVITWVYQLSNDPVFYQTCNKYEWSRSGFNKAYSWHISGIWYIAHPGKPISSHPKCNGIWY